MNHYNLLTEIHDLSYGDTVTVYERNDKPYTNKTFSYTGTVDRIIFKKMNERDPISPRIDHIYVKFSKNVYNHLLKRGSKVFCKGKPRIIGNIIRNYKKDADGNVIDYDIRQIFIQYNYNEEETEIDLGDINSMLIWRVAYEIVKYD